MTDPQMEPNNRGFVKRLLRRSGKSTLTKNKSSVTKNKVHADKKTPRPKDRSKNDPTNRKFSAEIVVDASKLKTHRTTNTFTDEFGLDPFFDQTLDDTVEASNNLFDDPLFEDPPLDNVNMSESSDSGVSYDMPKESLRHSSLATNRNTHVRKEADVLFRQSHFKTIDSQLQNIQHKSTPIPNATLTNVRRPRSRSVEVKQLPEQCHSTAVPHRSFMPVADPLHNIKRRPRSRSVEVKQQPVPRQIHNVVPDLSPNSVSPLTVASSITTNRRPIARSIEVKQQPPEPSHTYKVPHNSTTPVSPLNNTKRRTTSRNIEYKQQPPESCHTHTVVPQKSKNLVALLNKYQQPLEPSQTHTVIPQKSKNLVASSNNTNRRPIARNIEVKQPPEPLHNHTVVPQKSTMSTALLNNTNRRLISRSVEVKQPPESSHPTVVSQKSTDPLNTTNRRLISRNTEYKQPPEPCHTHTVVPQKSTMSTAPLNNTNRRLISRNTEVKQPLEPSHPTLVPQKSTMSTASLNTTNRGLISRSVEVKQQPGPSHPTLVPQKYTNPTAPLMKTNRRPRSRSVEVKQQPEPSHPTLIPKEYTIPTAAPLARVRRPRSRSVEVKQSPPPQQSHTHTSSLPLLPSLSNDEEDEYLQLNRAMTLSQRRKGTMIPRNTPLNPRVTPHKSPFKSNRKDLSSLPRSRMDSRLYSAAAVPIQTLVRRILAHTYVTHQLNHLQVIQRSMRRYSAIILKEFCIYGVVCIQAVFRGWIARDTVDDHQYCATLMQKIVRRLLAENNLFRSLDMVIMMQSCRRRMLVERKVHVLQESLVRVQCWVRCHTAKTQWMIRRKQNACAINIQRIVRGYFEELHAFVYLYNVTKIQSVIRRHLVGTHATRLQELYVTLQCWVKIRLAKRQWKEQQTCVIQIQSMLRKYRDELSVVVQLYSLTILQSCVRRQKAIRTCKTMHVSVVRIQSWIRGQFVRWDLHIQQEQCLLIQALWRTYSEQLRFYFQLVDITILQSVVRRRAALRTATCKCLSILKLQSWCRGQLVRGRTNRQSHKCVRIQAHWRAYCGKLLYQYQLMDIHLCQSVVRRWSCTRWVQMFRVNYYNSNAVILQATVRGYREYKTYTENRAAIPIQTMWRYFQCYSDYIFQCADISICQRVVRRQLALRKRRVLRKYMLKEKWERKAIVLQTLWRGYQCQQCLMYQFVDVIIAQSVVRRHQAIQAYQPIRHSTRVIQTHIRSTLARQDLHQFQAACTIQTHWRGIYSRCIYLEELWLREDSTIKLQSLWRGYSQYREYGVLRYEQHQSSLKEVGAIKLQTLWRGYWQYVDFGNMIHEQSQAWLKEEAATKLQTLWRGYWQYVEYGNLLHVQHQSWLKENAAINNHYQAATTIQSFHRGVTARTQLHIERITTALLFSSQYAIRTQVASLTLQRWWIPHFHQLKFKRQKQAALTLERFFLWVKHDVEREIQQHQQLEFIKKQQKIQQQQQLFKKQQQIQQQQQLEFIKKQERDRKKKAMVKKRQQVKKQNHAEEELLDHVWQNSVQMDNRSYAERKSPRTKQGGGSKVGPPQRPSRRHLHGLRQKNALSKRLTYDPSNIPRESLVSTSRSPINYTRAPSLRAPSNPTLGTTPPPLAVQISNDAGDSDSDMSGLTAPTMISNVSKLVRRSLEQDLSLEEAWMDTHMDKTRIHSPPKPLRSMDAKGKMTLVGRKNGSVSQGIWDPTEGNLFRSPARSLRSTVQYS